MTATALLAGLAALDTLDIGGGFPVAYGADDVDIDAFCAPIRAALACLPPHVRVIAEPGRFIAAPSAIAIATVMGKARRGGEIWYYLDDGLYGSYSGQLYDHARYPIEVVRVAVGAAGPSPANEEDTPLPVRERSTQSGEGLLPSVLAGPTCDSIDVIAENLSLPELQIGDLVVGRHMGAYTWASATNFNFFPRARVVVMNESAACDGRVVPMRRRRA